MATLPQVPKSDARTPFERLCEDGFCTFPGTLTREFVAELRALTDRYVDAMTDEERQRLRYQGSSVLLDIQEPVFRRLIAWDASLAALASLGYPEPMYWSGFILSKNPGAPALYWHQDYPFWDEPVSAEAEPAQVFLMYYLTDTRRENGCLRVIPGTHARRIPFHDELPVAHTDETYTAPEDSIAFLDHPDAIDVPVRAGDLVIGDARILHAAHPNRSDERRTCLTLWYYPRYGQMSESLRSALRVPPVPDDIPAEDRAKLQRLRPMYTGTAERTPWNRTPGIHLRP
ncbi:phytanoyl-CoA dioxygenase family protein [Candidatus Poribacteria bacterium]|nr:phytanoyl-CoA dioxygenase family protein [Candidatus Poribacteria bacterium]